MSNLDPIQTAREILEGKKTDEQPLAEESLISSPTEAEAIAEETVVDEDVVSSDEEIVEIVAEASSKKSKEDVDEEDEDDCEDEEMEDEEYHDEDDEDEDDEEMEENKTKKESIEIDTDAIVEASNSDNESEDMVALFSGEELTEDFKSKARTIFDIAVTARVKELAEAVETEANAQLDTRVNEVKDDLAESLDDYLGYVVNEWVSDNELAIEGGIKNDISESFMSGLKNLFETHYIDMPDEKYNLVSEMESKVVSLEGKLNEQMQKNIELNKNLSDSHCTEIFSEVAKGLTDTEVEKLSRLAEGIEFDTPEQYREKLDVLKESYFGKTSRSTNVVDETEEFTGEESSSDEHPFRDPHMKSYANYLSRQGKHNKF